MKPVSAVFFELVRQEPRLSAITEGAVASALDGFPLALKRDVGWLTEALRNVLFVSLTPPENGTERQTDAASRKELERLAKQAGETWVAIFDRSEGADAAVFGHSWKNWTPPVGSREIDGVAVAEPPAHKQFNAALAQLDWLARFLKGAADGLEPERGPWKSAILREERVYRAQCLSTVYEKAFLAVPTIVTWPSGRPKPKTAEARAKALGKWADFYQRIVGLTFREGATPDLEGVLDEARRRHKAHRIEFAEGIIPK